MLFSSELTQFESRGGDRNGDLATIDSSTFSGVDTASVMEDTLGPGDSGGEGGLSSSLPYCALEPADAKNGLVSP